MSIKVMSWVWEHSRAEGIELLVMLAIADHASDDGSDSYPSIEWLALKTRVSERTVQRAIRALTLKGEVTTAFGAGRHGTNVYTVNMSPRTDDTPDVLTPVTESPRQSDTVTAVTPQGDKRVTRTVLNRPTTPQPPARGGRRRSNCPKHSRHNSKCGECVRLEERDAREADWPPWCGICDEHTRKRRDELRSRCPDCHPLRKAAAS